MSEDRLLPRDELSHLTGVAVARGMSAVELRAIQDFGTTTGYGIQAQLDQLYVWLAAHPASKPASAS